ncbi:hypothetical protein BGZ47_006942 [Haplosporangium gracile]|nr:hypothetical protein BGZ47_006942 [Haplosporangium gracile]
MTTRAPKQKFKYGDESESLHIRYDQDGHYYYSRLDDIRNAFFGARQFRVNGNLVRFLVDNNGQCHIPPRIAHYPNEIVEISTSGRSTDSSSSSGSTIVEIGDDRRPIITISGEIHTGLSVAAGTSPLPSTPLTSSSAQSRAEANTTGDIIPVRPPSLDQSYTPGQPPVPDHVLPLLNMVSFSRLIEVATDNTDSSQFPPRTSSLAADRASAAATAKFDTPLSRSNSTQRRAPSSGKTTLTSSSISPPAPLPSHFPPPLNPIPLEHSERFSVISNDASNHTINKLINMATDRKSEKFGELLRYYGNLVRQERYVFELRLSSQNLLPLHNHNPQRPTGPKQGAIDRKLKAILIQSHGMHEYIVPKFFVLLPETLERFDHKSLGIEKPYDFLKRYGTYVLGMLQVLNYCLRTVTVAHETFHAAATPGVESLSNKTLADYSITEPSPTATSDGSEQTKSLPNVAALEGAGLRRLTTFLRYSDGDGILGNLYRITTSEGYVKWVCHEHYRQSLRDTTMNSFLKVLKENNGAYDSRVRKVTISLTSSADSKTFFETFASQASDVDELDVVFDGWNFWSWDLESLVKAVCQSNVKSLKLDLKDSQVPALFELLWSKKLQGLSLSGAGGFGLRTSDFEMGPHFSNLQSFHFLHAIKTSDQLRLMKLLTYCHNLTDLRLGDYVNRSKIQQQMMPVIAAMEHLRTLHLYNVQGESENPVSGLLYVFANRVTSLKELVCYAGRVDEWELGEVIKYLSRTIEVLVVEQVPPSFLDLVPVATNTGPTEFSAAYFQ